MEQYREPFVEGWEFVQTLGEGAYGEVKLAVCRASMECVAVKIIHLTDSTVEENVKKEICIHRMVNHKNVIKFYGYRKANNIQYLFLKYACGGELFDRIEPDKGMKLRDALRYFHQLIEGVEYLHSIGVCHRDLKPENLLLDENDVLQITDFGMATVFRYKGVEREVSRMCGTKPYTAPEVLKGTPYRAEPADVWSCAIILVTLLAGELPWDVPIMRDRMYRQWRERCITKEPWKKMDTLALSLFRSVLVEDPKRRYTIEQIKKHQFYNKTFALQEEEENSCSSSGVKRRNSLLDEMGHLSSPQGVFSQPDRSNNENSLSPLAEVRHPISFSQPAQSDDLLLNSQLQCTPATSQTPFQKLVRRMTRFFVLTTRQETVKAMTELLESHGYVVKKNSSILLTVSTVDKTKARLIFKICLIDMAGNLLVDFRLSKGDGLEFKRHFVKIKEKVKHIIRKTPPSWPQGGVTDSESAADRLSKRLEASSPESLTASNSSELPGSSEGPSRSTSNSKPKNELSDSTKPSSSKATASKKDSKQERLDSKQERPAKRSRLEITEEREDKGSTNSPATHFLELQRRTTM
ncbi:serine/threonine-protein kinase Chk1 [Biomphalaria glabrata]|uniref:Serine/threonine-protein kinase CHK1 n=1 Tax=Biomphalaria glabrata TaxID=6526 RepID=A0A9W2YXA5_BIOGL|nr:serine/threonine-protein kinase Chk1-like [Biomphalaria glabrata]XP_055867352.1 serine/threonine-protein kinase Chk1-like [Biomphalaria glabrata]KAI8734516.1 serine/threonine-protein kinase Chk1-like [Biomphalaria glabrata]